MPNVRLTALSVERAFRNDPRFLLNDGDGLYLRKQANSGASWTLRYRFAERNRWMTLGHYPDMNLATARAEARTKRILLDKHQDPLELQSTRGRMVRDRDSRSHQTPPGSATIYHQAFDSRVWLEAPV